MVRKVPGWPLDLRMVVRIHQGQLDYLVASVSSGADIKSSRSEKVGRPLVLPLRDTHGQTRVTPFGDRISAGRGSWTAPVAPP
jgi:hypothetical protein